MDSSPPFQQQQQQKRQQQQYFFVSPETSTTTRMTTMSSKKRPRLTNHDYHPNLAEADPSPSCHNQHHQENFGDENDYYYNDDDDKVDGDFYGSFDENENEGASRGLFSTNNSNSPCHHRRHYPQHFQQEQHQYETNNDHDGDDRPFSRSESPSFGNLPSQEDCLVLNHHFQQQQQQQRYHQNFHDHNNNNNDGMMGTDDHYFTIETQDSHPAPIITTEEFLADGCSESPIKAETMTGNNIGTNDDDDDGDDDGDNNPTTSVCITTATDSATTTSSSVAAAAAAATETTRTNPTLSLTTPPTTRLKDIIGHGAIKLRMDEILLPLALPAAVTRRVYTGIRAAHCATSILLYGPPGCGKTQFAAALAGEAAAAFVTVGPSDILSKFVGESEAAVRAVFAQATALAYTVESHCTVVFWDEIDALGMSRNNGANAASGGGSGTATSGGESEGCSRRILAELLLQFNRLGKMNTSIQSSASSEEDEEDDHDESQPTHHDKSNNNNNRRENIITPRILMIAATNRPQDLDPALLRRFGMRLYVGYPTERDRRKILQRLLQHVRHSLTRGDWQRIAAATPNWSGAALEQLAHEAAMAPVRECLAQAARARRRQERKMRQQKRRRRRRCRQQSNQDESSHNDSTRNRHENTWQIPEESQDSLAVGHEGDNNDGEDYYDVGTSNDPEDSSSADGLEQARHMLVSNLQDLRPVNLQDFVQAIEFIAQQNDAVTPATGSSRARGEFESGIAGTPSEAAEWQYETTSDEESDCSDTSSRA